MKMTFKTLSLAALLATFGLFLVGCGGGSTMVGDSDAPETEDEELNQLMDEMDGAMDEMESLDDLDTDF